MMHDGAGGGGAWKRYAAKFLLRLAAGPRSYSSVLRTWDDVCGGRRRVGDRRESNSIKTCSILPCSRPPPAMAGSCKRGAQPPPPPPSKPSPPPPDSRQLWHTRTSAHVPLLEQGRQHTSCQVHREQPTSTVTVVLPATAVIIATPRIAATAVVRGCSCCHKALPNNLIDSAGQLVLSR